MEPRLLLNATSSQTHEIIGSMTGRHLLSKTRRAIVSVEFFGGHKLSIPTSSLNIEGSRPGNELGRTEAEAVVNEMGSGRSIRFEWFRI